MNDYISRESAVDAGYLSDWYISSVGNELPVWTDAHIDELLNDFIVIPKDTKSSDVQPVVDVPKIEVKPMAEEGLQILIKGIFRRIKEKYGYTDEQVRIYLQGCQDCAEENQQSLEKRDKMLRDTVAELVEAKRLLKLAVDDIARTESCFLCKYYDRPDESCQTTDDCFVWRYADEALKLIKEEE